MGYFDVIKLVYIKNFIINDVRILFVIKMKCLKLLKFGFLVFI